MFYRHIQYLFLEYCMLELCLQILITKRKEMMMNNKTDYLKENEIKLKTLLSDMYTNESEMLARIHRKKEKLDELKAELSELEKEYKEQNDLREDLTKKFEELQNSKSADWEKFKSEFEMALNLAEGDKSSFVKKAEEFLDDLSDKVLEMEKKVQKSSAKTKGKYQKMLDELKGRREDLQKSLDEAKADSGEAWKDIKHWFNEKSKSIRSMF